MSLIKMTTELQEISQIVPLTPNQMQEMFFLQEIQNLQDLSRFQYPPCPFGSIEQTKDKSEKKGCI